MASLDIQGKENKKGLYLIHSSYNISFPSFTVSLECGGQLFVMTDVNQDMSLCTMKKHYGTSKIFINNIIQIAIQGFKYQVRIRKISL